MKNKLTVGISPCPNDTFMFDAIINKKIDTADFEFEFVITDVENLNKRALKFELDITKVSYFTYFRLQKYYDLLESGSALGYNCGPLLISREWFDTSDIRNLRIAIPGKNTTANFLLTYAFPKAVNKIEILFSEIENAILNNEVDAGVIIHENRFTFEDKGLVKITDLGEYWQNKTNCPVPLGGIIIRNNIDNQIKRKFENILRNSIQFAFDNPSSGMKFIKLHASEMDDHVIRQHIDTYVNEYSLKLGKKGKEAVEKFLESASKIFIPQYYDC